MRRNNSNAPQVPAGEEAGTVGADAEPGEGATCGQQRERERVGGARAERGRRRRGQHHCAGRPALADELKEDLAREHMQEVYGKHMHSGHMHLKVSMFLDTFPAHKSCLPLRARFTTLSLSACERQHGRQQYVAFKRQTL